VTLIHRLAENLRERSPQRNAGLCDIRDQPERSTGPLRGALEESRASMAVKASARSRGGKGAYPVELARLETSRRRRWPIRP